MPTPAAVLADLVKRFRPEAAEGLNVVYQLHLTGEGGGFWHLSIADQQCRLSPGPATDPDVAIVVSTEDCGELAAGRLDPVAAFLSRRLQVSGRNFHLATRLKSIFDL